MDIGQRLKVVRKKYSMSQRELAKRAGVTNSTISMIEKNSVSPSISSLRKVLSGIPITLVEFFAEEDGVEDELPVAYKKEDLLDIRVKEVKYKLVGKFYKNRAMTFMEETYAPGSDTGDTLLIREGQEAGIILSGKLVVTSGSKSYTVEEGEAYYIDCTRPHKFENPFNEPCKLITSATPAHF